MSFARGAIGSGRFPTKNGDLGEILQLEPSDFKGCTWAL